MLKILPGNGFFLSNIASSGPVTIGGACELGGALSPNSGLPLTQHAAVRMSVSGFGVPDFDVPMLHFLYSWKCNISMGDFTYRYLGSRIEILDFVEVADDYEGFPYEKYPVVFPSVSFELGPISYSDKLIIAILNDPDGDDEFKFESERASELSIPAHQFGGMPFLLNSNINKYCYVCGQEMLLTASIGNNCFSSSNGFFGNDFVQLVFFTCAPCKVVSALNIAG
jgi:hypothetical protein